MKQSLAVSLISIVVTALVCWKLWVQTPQLKSAKEKASYSLGTQIGRNLKNQRIDFDARALVLALEDQNSERQSRLSEQELVEGLGSIHKSAAVDTGQQVENQKTNTSEIIQRDSYRFKYILNDENQEPRRFKPGKMNLKKKYKIHVRILNQNEEEIFNSREQDEIKESTLGDWPLPIREPISTMNQGERVLIYVDSVMLTGRFFEKIQNLQGELQVEVEVL